MQSLTRKMSLSDKPLWIVFWLYGVLLSHLLWGISLAVYYSDAALGSVIVAFTLLLAYTVWILYAIWHSSGNVQNPLHGEMARFLTAAWGINALLLVAFLLAQRTG